MLIDWVWLSQIGRYLALGHGTRTSLCSVRTSWPRPEYFPSGPPTQSVSTYFSVGTCGELYFEAVSVKQNVFYHILHFPIPNYQRKSCWKLLCQPCFTSSYFGKSLCNSGVAPFQPPPLPVFPPLVFNRRLHTCRQRLCRFLILFMINRFMWLYFYF